MTRNSVVTTGCLGGETLGAMAPNRLEISDFIKNEKMFSLYIQALRTLRVALSVPRRFALADTLI